MSLVRARRLLNAIETGTTNATVLETLLLDEGRFSELSILFDMPLAWGNSTPGTSTLIGTATAGALTDNPSKQDTSMISLASTTFSKILNIAELDLTNNMKVGRDQGTAVLNSPPSGRLGIIELGTA